MGCIRENSCKKKIMLVFGTRPEAVKMCPLIKEFQKDNDIEIYICLTGQHREMLDQVMADFGIKPDYNLNIMKQGQTLEAITSAVIENLSEILRQERPNLVLVHGDTTTTFAAALASFYQQIPVAHVEAGLRTGNSYSPFPEEMNRRLTGQISSIHFTPTEGNKRNLEKENIKDNVYVTGNTVIDAFQYTVDNNYVFHDNRLNDIQFNGKRTILLTSHRRENIGQPLVNICKAVKRTVMEYKDIQVIYPVHLNPKVQEIVQKELSGQERVHLIDPLEVFDMHNLMKRSFLIMTDSGGIQEEAPALGIPVLVLRKETERPEAVQAGTVKLTGTEEANIYNDLVKLLDNQELYHKMAQAVNPYGDGHASERIVNIIKNVI